MIIEQHTCDLEIEKHLRLNAKIIEPSRAALFRWVRGLLT
jgi:hypothetical protein